MKAGLRTHAKRPIHSVLQEYFNAVKKLKIPPEIAQASLVIRSATNSRCKVLYREDLQTDRQFGNLKIVNPFI
ncbi:MAG: hypothetical protein KF760_05220 [Candidatus Eremiobacteraeota bacterium]|nr:hypothetical protein [Candidatus Eremiobacteraeota bacterium]MCW5867190.1 hypothetical protein [Candidatus Eremiobacteraeota bacterium]